MVEQWTGNCSQQHIKSLLDFQLKVGELLNGLCEWTLPLLGEVERGRENAY